MKRYRIYQQIAGILYKASFTKNTGHKFQYDNLSDAVDVIRQYPDIQYCVIDYEQPRYLPYKPGFLNSYRDCIVAINILGKTYGG